MMPYFDMSNVGGVRDILGTTDVLKIEGFSGREWTSKTTAGTIV